MKPVQLILIMMMLSITFIYFSKFRSGIIDRVLVLIFGVLGIVMTTFPDVTTYIANAVGVGRGADLFTALALVGIAFFGMIIYSRIRELESSITTLSRELAIQRAKQPEDTQDAESRDKKSD